MIEEIVDEVVVVVEEEEEEEEEISETRENPKLDPLRLEEGVQRQKEQFR